jgi:hypothetical protein
LLAALTVMSCLGQLAVSGAGLSEGFRRSSPLRYIKNARTPTLRGLPREGNGFHEEKHLTDRLRRIVA